MAQKVYNVIRYEGGDNRVLVYKTEITDFSNESVIIVDESQQALLYKDGQAEGPLTSGRHVLPTNNISLFRKLFAKLFRRTDKLNENTPFTCDVYFVNMVNDVTLDWGTPSRTMVKDPVYNELVNVGANGNVKVKVSDPMRFVVTINGKMGGYTIERLTATVRGEIMTVIKTYIAEIIVNQQVSLLEIQTKLLSLSQSVEAKLNERLADFGLQAVHLNVLDISLDAESQKRLLERQRIINARSDLVQDAAATTDAEAYRTQAQANSIRELAKARAEARQAEGYSYQEERAFDIQQTMAKNPAMGVPPMYPYGGMMPNAMGGMMPNMMGGMVPPMYPYGMGMQQPPIACPHCGNPVQAGAQFCGACGGRIMKPVNPADSTVNPDVRKHNYSAPAEGRNCPRCGYPLLPRNTTCPDCGYDLEKNDGE